MYQLNDYRTEVSEALESIDLDKVRELVDLLLAARAAHQTIFIVGNGGSATTANHMATDLMLGSELVAPGLRVISLADNQGIITATGNDVSFDEIFARQLDNLGQEGDLLIAFSASGNSPNILTCVERARQLRMVTVSLTGFDGGQLLKMADTCIHVQTRFGAYGPVEDAHLVINHMVTEALKWHAAWESELS